MSHEITLSQAKVKAIQLHALLSSLAVAADVIDSDEVKTLAEMALDLAADSVCWLMEEAHQREVSNA
ncbi:hypothetical protein [Serratia sp. PL7]|uniref:hypothetical protein n=1 Tax=Serratia sp. PL7 TaxID=2952201 RepID=UPI0019D82F88|nr:hypothetical protein [Serratia sp. PL7]MBE0149624.1 hypothetical protein [Serratia fonticola]